MSKNNRVGQPTFSSGPLEARPDGVCVVRVMQAFAPNHTPSSDARLIFFGVS